MRKDLKNLIELMLSLGFKMKVLTALVLGLNLFVADKGQEIIRYSVVYNEAIVPIRLEEESYYQKKESRLNPNSK